MTCARTESSSCPSGRTNCSSPTVQAGWRALRTVAGRRHFESVQRTPTSIAALGRVDVRDDCAGRRRTVEPCVPAPRDGTAKTTVEPILAIPTPSSRSRILSARSLRVGGPGQRLWTAISGPSRGKSAPGTPGAVTLNDSRTVQYLLVNPLRGSGGISDGPR